MNILPAIIEVLKDARTPLHARQIALEIDERGLAEGTPQSLEPLVHAQVGGDIRDREEDDLPPRFRRFADGTVALADQPAGFGDPDADPDGEDGRPEPRRDDEEDDAAPRDADRRSRRPEGREVDFEYEDLRDRIDDHNGRIARRFARDLNGVDFATFERHMSTLIRSFAVRRCVIVNRRKDGGMDYAVNLGHLRNNLNLLVAVRRWGSRRKVAMDDLRESFERMKAHGFNALVFVTSGDFEEAVYDHADSFKDFPLFLVNGDKLAWLMLERRAVQGGADRVSVFHPRRTPSVRPAERTGQGRPPRGDRPPRAPYSRDGAYPPSAPGSTLPS